MIYTALGDSITYGRDASRFANSYHPMTVSAMRSRSARAQGRLLASPGWTSADLRRAISRWGQPFLQDATVVSVWIGGNDLGMAALVALAEGGTIDENRIVDDYRRNLAAIATEIHRVSDARLLCCTQYNPFPNSPYAENMIGRLNRATQETARNFRAGIVPVHIWFAGKQPEFIYGYRDGKMEDATTGQLPVHPNDRGHNRIAHGMLAYM